MDQRRNVPTQAALAALLISAIAVCAGGHDAGFAALMVLVSCASVWFAFAATYRFRASKQRTGRRILDYWALASVVVGFGLPMVICLELWLRPESHGLLFDSQAAAFCTVLLTACGAAILTSSMIDWYYVLPRVFGIIGPAAWTSDKERASPPHKAMNRAQRRRIARAWIFQRCACEIFVAACLGFFIVIVFVAAGDALPSDRTLPVAFASASGVVVSGGLAIVGPRVGGAFQFINTTGVGVGDWVQRIHEETGMITAEGLIVDVSISPGIKIIQVDGSRKFTELADGARLHAVPRPKHVDNAWCRDAFSRHLGSAMGLEAGRDAST